MESIHPARRDDHGDIAVGKGGKTGIGVARGHDGCGDQFCRNCGLELDEEFSRLYAFKRVGYAREEFDVSALMVSVVRRWWPNGGTQKKSRKADVAC